MSNNILKIFREFLTTSLLPTSNKEPDIPACRKFVTEFAIQVQNRILFQIRNSGVIFFRLPGRLFAPLALQLPFYLTCLMCSPWKVARNCLKQSNKRYFLVDMAGLSQSSTQGVYMEGDCLLHLLHQEQSAENLQRSPSSTESNTEHCVLWKNSPFPRQILPLLRKVLSPVIF